MLKALMNDRWSWLWWWWWGVNQRGFITLFYMIPNDFRTAFTILPLLIGPYAATAIRRI